MNRPASSRLGRSLRGLIRIRMDVRTITGSVIEDMDKSCWSCAHDPVHRPCKPCNRERFRACFVVDRIQFLINSPFLSHSCLQTKGNDRQVSLSDDGPQDDWTRFKNYREEYGTRPRLEKIYNVHVSLYNRKSGLILFKTSLVPIRLSVFRSLKSAKQSRRTSNPFRDPGIWKWKMGGSTLTQRLPATVLDIS
jgi:hypothetical protein